MVHPLHPYTRFAHFRAIYSQTVSKQWSWMAIRITLPLEALRDDAHIPFETTVRQSRVVDVRDTIKKVRKKIIKLDSLSLGVWQCLQCQCMPLCHYSQRCSSPIRAKLIVTQCDRCWAQTSPRIVCARKKCAGHWYNTAEPQPATERESQSSNHLSCSEAQE